ADDDEWTTLNASGVGWMIRGNMATTDIDIDNMAWTTITCDEDTCLLTGLQTEMDYIYQVRGNYGAEGYSAWATGFFTTTNENPVVHNVEVTPSETSATISWTGYSDSYKVRYRSLAYERILSTSFSDDFESGNLDKWTTIRNKDGIDNTDWQVYDADNFSSGMVAHSGDYVALSRSWSNVAYEVENWLISPAVILDGTLTYWAMGDESYPEHYDVYVSTTTNDINEFVKVYEPADVTDSWTKHTVDLSGYNGVMGYIAFCNADYDQDFLLIDDVVINISESTPAGDWQEINTTASSIELTGLTSDVEYEYQIISIKAGQPNSETNIATFKTTKTSFDLNGDGRLDGADVMSLADIVVGNLNASSYPMSTIDINNDGVITIADITALVNKILNIVP
ncbi:MAG: choice-of-anchor J domain-containing protein, partial [Bacteroidaceae bacterium]|nr:choice-of-anchor J domain-containing protein [Bacteroidaceae bacterium]